MSWKKCNCEENRIHCKEVNFGAEIRYKKLSDLAKEPTRGSAAAAGYDLYAATAGTIAIEPHQTVKIGTDLAFELPDYTFGAIFARSGLATKKGLRPANCVGVCDEAYRGEYIVALHNDSNEPRTITSCERIAQLVFLPYLDYNFIECNELDKTDRGADGFGSSGK